MSGRAVREVARYLALAVLLSAAAGAPSAAAQVLEFVEAELNGVGGITEMGGSRFVAVSPDGRHVYTSAEDNGAIVVFDRDRQTGELTQIQAVVDNIDGDGIEGTSTLVVSPDGRHVYAGGTFEHAIAVFARNPASGELTFTQVIREGVDLADGLSSVVWIAISPDGKNVYTSAFSDDTVLVFARNPADGTLSFVQLLKDGVGGVNFLDGTFPVEVSPDGKNVYVGSLREHAVSVFARDHATGVLTLVQVVEDLVGDVEGLFFTRGLAVSRNGKQVYVVGFLDSSLVVFKRDPSTGKLTFVEVERNGVGGITGMRRPTYVAESPNGKYVFVAGINDDSVVAFRRDANDGTVSYLETVFEGVNGVTGLDGAIALAIGRGGASNLYVASFGTNVGDGSVAVFDIE